jgi:hypothetical protein
VAVRVSNGINDRWSDEAGTFTFDASLDVPRPVAVVAAATTVSSVSAGTNAAPVRASASPSNAPMPLQLDVRASHASCHVLQLVDQ